MSYLVQPANKYTFKMPRVKKWVQRHCKGNILNLFAGKTKLHANEVRVDIDPAVNPDYCCDAHDFVRTWNGKKFDTVILDPPYNVRKAREKYNGNWIGSFTKIKDILPNIINNGGIVIIFGYDTTGMGKKRGFKKIEILVINHCGDFNDTLALVEQKINQTKITEFE